MKINFFIVLISLCIFIQCSASSILRVSNLSKEDFQNINQLNLSETLDDPLFYTKFIKNNQFHEVKKKALTSIGSVKSYTGFFTVDKKCFSNLFTWFFPHKNKDAPILVWLQGGPGASSLYGLFVEHGPFYVTKDLELKKREYAWTNEFSLLYIDNPVGAGFSFTDNDDCYSKNQKDVARNLYELLKQFFTLFSEYQSNPFYITGESYAGKYVPSISNYIIENSEESSKYFNFEGIAIGNGWIDPIHQIQYGKYLHEINLIDAKQEKIFEDYQNKTIDLIKQEKWIEAFNKLNLIVNGDLNTSSLYNNFTGLTNYFNYLNNYSLNDENFVKYLTQNSIRKQIHIGNLTFNDGQKTEIYLMEDLPRSVRDDLLNVIKNKRVLIYHGQLDVICAANLVENVLLNLEDNFGNLFYNETRKIWKAKPTDKDVSGYIKQLNNFYFVVIRNGGHMLPADQPRVTYELINSFIFSKL